MEHAALYTLLWSIALVAVFLPLSVRRYKKAAAR
jgi:predicted secreted protein